MVVVLKRGYPVLILLLAGVVIFSGCRRPTTEQAIDQAATELGMFGRSQSAMLANFPDVEISQADLDAIEGVSSAQFLQNRQNIERITSEQEQRFQQAIDQLRRHADTPVKTSGEAKTAAQAKTLLAGMLNYQINWTLDALNQADSKLVEPEEKIRLINLQIERAASDWQTDRPENYEPAIQESEQTIASMKIDRERLAGQLEKIQSGIEGIEEMQAGMTKVLTVLNQRISRLSEQMIEASAEEAVELQKQIATQERQRLNALTAMERLEEGPMNLPSNRQVDLDDRTLIAINGALHMRQEAELLEDRIARIDESIDAQQLYLENLRQQMQISDRKGAELSERIDRLEKELKNHLATLAEKVADRQALLERAIRQIEASERYSQQAGQDLARYLNAVRQARGQLGPGREDPFLKAAQETESLEFTIGNVLAVARMNRAGTLAQTVRFDQRLVPVLMQSRQLTTLPEDLEAYVGQARERQESSTQELSAILDQTIAQYQTLFQKARRGDSQVVVGTALAQMLTQASGMAPQQSDTYLAQAREVLETVMSQAPASADQRDPLLAPARQLRQELGM